MISSANLSIVGLSNGSVGVRRTDQLKLFETQGPQSLLNL